MSLQPPYVAFACMCEKVLQEQDGVLSAIRIVDSLHMRPVPQENEAAKSGGPSAAKAGGTPIAGINILIGLKSGDYRGTGKLILKAHSPDGQVMSGLKMETEVELKGGHQGGNVIINAGIPFTEDGVYWIDVIFENRVLTRMPIAVSVYPPSTAKSEPEPAQAERPRSKR